MSGEGAATWVTRLRPLRGSSPRGKTILRRLPLHEDVAAHLREMIVSGELAGGAKVPLNEVAAALGVSLTPLREALKVLASERLIELTPNRGARVSPINVEETRALFEVMSGIEALAAELAAERMRPAERAALEALQATMCGHAARGEKAPYFELNRQIHDLIVIFAGNPILVQTRALLSIRAERARRLSVEAGRQRVEAMTDHHALMAAFRARDALAARRIWRRHLLRSGDECCEVLREASRPGRGSWPGRGA